MSGCSQELDSRLRRNEVILEGVEQERDSAQRLCRDLQKQVEELTDRAAEGEIARERAATDADNARDDAARSRDELARALESLEVSYLTRFMRRTAITVRILFCPGHAA